MSAPDFDPEAPHEIVFRGPDVLVRAHEVVRDKIREEAEEARTREEIEATRPATALEALEPDRPLGWLLARLPAWEAALGTANLRLELVSYDAADEGPSGNPNTRLRDELDARGLWCPSSRERDFLKVNARTREAALVGWVQGEIDKGRDVAASSRFSWKVKGSVRYGHLPCYDFSALCPSADGVSHAPADCVPVPSGTRERASARVQTAHLAWFASGRSYHAYDERGPLPWTTWARLMGGALSLNCGGSEVFDPGWLAFALARGYAALRVTKTHASYLALPKKLPWPPTWGQAEVRT